jgi:DNA-binding XRE family transcriptional regulator
MADGPTIRRIREDQGMTPGELAARIGRHRETIYRTESGGRPVSRVLAAQIARALGVTIEDVTKARDDEEQVLAS